MNGIHQRPWKGNPNTLESEPPAQGSGNTYEWHIFLSCIRSFNEDGPESGLRQSQPNLAFKYGLNGQIPFYRHVLILLKDSALLQAQLAIFTMQFFQSFSYFNANLATPSEGQTDQEEQKHSFFPRNDFHWAVTAVKSVHIWKSWERSVIMP